MKYDIKEEFKNIDKALVLYSIGLAVIFMLAVFGIMLILNSESAPEVKYRRPVYDPVSVEAFEETALARGYTKEIEPYANMVKANLLTDKLLVINYKIRQKNESLWTIKNKFRINLNTIIGANPYLKTYEARPGQELIIINRIGVLHRIRKDETLEQICELYGKKKEEVLIENELYQSMSEDSFLFIPRAEPVDLTPEMKEQFALRKIFGFPFKDKWHRRSSGFGYRSDPFTGEKSFHSGFDLRADYGDKICSVADGVVIFSGEDGAFGNAVKIKHAGGYVTLYGHCEKLLVNEGKKVKRGDVIALVGSTGRSTGPHLHFTVWKKGALVNPKPYLLQ